MLSLTRQHRTDLHRRLASQYSSHVAPCIRLLGPHPTIVRDSHLQRNHGRDYSAWLSWKAAHPERPFWKLRCTEKVEVELKESRHSKWGFVLYKCTYENDSAWEHFTEIVRQRAKMNLEADKGIDISACLDFTFREDRSTFDGATVDQVRNHFKAWIKLDDQSQRTQAIKKEQGDGASSHLTPRYMFVIHVDAESLQSVVEDTPQPPKPDNDGIGYVNFVDRLWKLHPPIQCPEDADFDDGDEREWEDMGHMRFCLEGLHPRIYSLVSDRSTYYIFHKSQPEVSIW
jgi:hypothetical protein